LFYPNLILPSLRICGSRALTRSTMASPWGERRAVTTQHWLMRLQLSDLITADALRSVGKFSLSGLRMSFLYR
jgi:hypothetical protein